MNDPQRLPAAAAPEGVAQILALAFADDPLMEWLFPNGDERPRKLRTMMEAVVRHDFLPRGEVWVLDGGAAACWRPPGVHQGRIDALATAMADLLGSELGRAGALFEQLGRRHPSAPCWYLGVLGAVPERRGQGLGSKLLEIVLERADTAREPAYLEATSDRSRRLYERHGFEVIEEFQGPYEAPPLWLMWRA